MENQHGKLNNRSGETSRLSSETSDSSTKQSRATNGQKGKELLLKMIPVPEHHAMAAARGIVVICTLVATIFAIYHFWPKAPEYGGFPMTDNMVDVVDTMFLCAYFLPFGAALLLHQALVTLRTVDESVIDALALPEDKTKLLTDKSSAKKNTIPWWSPKWKVDSKIIGSTTRGKVIVLAGIVIANIIWWFVPVIIWIQVSRILDAQGSLDGQPVEVTARYALDKIFGWAGKFLRFLLLCFF
jgi:hypothetical protein